MHGFQPLLTPRDVAGMLKVSLHTVRSWVRYKRIGHLKVNGANRFTHEHVAAIMRDIPAVTEKHQ
jgi:excisionase family DNA binding protein